MKLIEVHPRLKKMAVPVCRTADVMAYLDIKKEHASNLLARLEDTHHIVRIKRGLWVFPEGLDPLALPEYLTAPFPSYISLQSQDCSVTCLNWNFHENSASEMYIK